MRLLITLLLVSQLSFGGVMDILSGKKPEPDVEKIPFPGNVEMSIRLSPTYNYIVSISNADGTETKELMRLDAIQMLTQFEGQSTGLKGISRRIEVPGKVPVSNWFAAQTLNELVIFFKGSKAIEPLILPLHTTEIKDISIVGVMVKGSSAEQSGKYLVISTRNVLAETKTYLLNLDAPGNANKYWALSDRYSPTIKGGIIDISKDPDMMIEIAGIKASIKQALSRESRSYKKTEKAEVAHAHLHGQILVDAKPDTIKTPGAPETAATEDNKEEGPKGTPTKINFEMANGAEKFQIYSSEAENGGIFVKRLSDGTVVKVSFLPLLPAIQGEHHGFVIKKGILSHPNLLRQIDLEKTDKMDAFKIESTFSPVYMGNDEENPRENRNAVEFINGFQSFKKVSERWLSPPEKRKNVVNEISSQILSGETVTQVIVGESTDKDMILGQVARTLPRTWKTINFETSGFGDISMSGFFQEKTGHIRSAIRQIPTVLFARNLTSFASFGSAGKSDTDIFQLMGPDFTDDSGYLKLVATATRNEELKEKIKDPGTISALATMPIENLNEKELKSYLTRFLDKNYPEVKITDEALEYLMFKASSVKKVNPEPRRSEDFLRALARKVKKGEIDRSEIDRGLTYAWGISPALATENGQIETINNFPKNVAKNLSGHEHIVSHMQGGLQMGLAGLHAERGGMSMDWIEGPPGVGKTELAKATAKAINVPLGYIDMNQFKVGSGNGSNELLAQMDKIISNNPYSVVLLDEVEKADFKVLESLLMALSNEKFTYFKDKEERAQTLNNATVILTSNGVGHLVLEWYYQQIEKDPRFDTMSSEQLNEEFKKFMSVEKIKELLTTPGAIEKFPQGLPAPLIDRVQIHVAFPPSFDAMVGIFDLKLREIKARAYKNMGIRVVLENDKMSEREIMKSYVAEARKNRVSVRDAIKTFERQVAIQTAEIRMKDTANFRKTGYYSVDPIGKKFKALVNRCDIFYKF
jgi:hypothetical protein